MSERPTWPDELVCTHPVELGSMLFTLVEPSREHVRQYNRWYERDHFYAGCMIGPFNFAGRRWVATRDLKALRIPARSPVIAEPDAGSYLALYWVLKEHHVDWNRWARREVKALIDADRMYEHRRHIHTQLYTYEWGVFRNDDPVPAELALDHPFAGLVVVWGRTAEARTATEDWFRTAYLPQALPGTAAAMCLGFHPIPMPSGQPSDVPSSDDDERRFLHLYFLDGDPRDAWTMFAGLPEAVGERAEILLASPFVPTIPGTDTYTDELW